MERIPVLPSLRTPMLVMGVSLAIAAMAHAQQVRAIAPVGAIAGQAEGAATDDPGTPVEMFENSNIDRYLNNAQAFLGREDYAAAIKVLQDVVDGRTVVVEATPAKPVEPATGEPKSDAPQSAARKPVAPADGEAPPRPKHRHARDARNSVFSQDGRLYRPVYRLCHELLARMPAVGIEIYRTNFEVPADELLQQAIASGSVGELEQVTTRYFVTLAAGRAMTLLADRLMHEGRYRAAVQVLRDLLEIYPADNRKRLGISDVWCKFKIALCLRFAGELEAAHATVVAMAAAHADESLRVLGELQAVKDLPNNSLFATDEIAVNRRAPTSSGPSWLAADTEELLPLWQYRFRNPEPYKDPKSSNDSGRNIFFEQGQSPNAMPFAGRYGPGTTVAFATDAAPRGSLPRTLFFEHYRLRLAEAASGVQVAQGDGVEEPSPPRENHPRVRIASSDFALLRPLEDEERRYAVVGHGRATTSSPEPLKASELIAYERDLQRRAWSSAQWLDGEAGLRDVTFLAAPTLFGERLLLPALRRGEYSLECVDRRTGRPLWHTPIHGGGSPFFKAPGCQVVVSAGIAYVATNAGCLAAIDAFAGDLRWVRRYERIDPVHKTARAKRARGQSEDYTPQFAQLELTSFLPNDLVVRDGLVVVAPCDGDVLLCIDGSTGKPVWMLDAGSRYVTKECGRLRMLIGAVGDDLFALSDTHLVTVSLSGGLVKQARELPVWNGSKPVGRGRGTIVGDQIVIPNQRELLVFDAAGQQPMRRLQLPSFDASREPYAGSCHVTAAGPWLAVGHPGGVEVYSSKSALQAFAATTADPLQRAQYMAQAGDGPAAEQVLVQALAATDLAAERRHALGGLLLGLVRERAAGLARGGDLPGALVAFDTIDTLMRERDQRLDWLLARVELCKEVGDLRAHEREQERLYACMEGKG